MSFTCSHHPPTPKAVSHTLPRGKEAGDEGFSRLGDLREALGYLLEWPGQTPPLPFTFTPISLRPGLEGALWGPSWGTEGVTLGIWDLEDVAAGQAGHGGSSG